ncbi:MAG: TolC family protein [Limnochordia bacterium]|jgi:outer membrane protein TolC
MSAKTRLLISSIMLFCLITSVLPVAAAEETTLTWEQAISRALTYHPQVTAAMTAEETALRAYERAASAYAPQLNLTSRPVSTGNRQDSSDKFYRYTESEARLTASLATSFGASGSISLGQAWSDNYNKSRTFVSLAANASLDPKGRLYSSTRMTLERARITAQKATWDRQEQIQATALNVLAEFWRLELDAQRLSITRESRERQAEIYDRVVERKRLGLATDTDVLEAEIEWCQAEVAAQKAEAEYRTRLLNLARNLNLSEDITLAPSGGFPEGELVDRFDEAALAEAVGERSTAVRKRLLDVDYSTLELQQALLAATWPDIGVSGNYTVPDLSKADPATSPWGVYINVELPIVDGGRRRLTVADKEAELKTAQTALMREQEGTLSALQQRLTNWEIARRQVEIARLKLTHAQLEEALKVRQHAGGLVSDSVLRTAQTDTLLAAVDLQEALHEQALAQLQIQAMAGETLAIAGRQLLPQE